MNTIFRITVMYVIVAALSLLALIGLLHSGTPTETYDSITDLFFLILAFAFTTLFMVLLLRLYKGDLIFKFLDFLIITSSTMVFYYGIVSILGFPEWISVVLSLLTGALKLKFPSIRNLAAVLASAGVAAVFGFYFELWQLILFSVFMGVYDYVAVFITRHMVSFARTFTHKNMSLSVSASHTSGKHTEYLELGTGDMIIPTALALSVFRTTYLQGTLSSSLLAYFVIMLYVVLSLIATLLAVQKRKLFLPALPPLISAALLGYVVLSLSHLI